MTTERTPKIDESQPAPSCCHRRRRWARIAIFLVVLLVAVELILRFGVGLGDPPLAMSDPQIEYLYQPNQTRYRFHNLVHYNAYSMRSDDFPPHKSRPGELRVMVVGDSVINGGATADQAQLATSILQKQLTEKLGVPLIVGNISTGGWGPPNEVAYLRKFGIFDADVLLIVVSSHDANDVHPVKNVIGSDVNWPSSTPICALSEAIVRYGPVVWWRMTHKHDIVQAPPTTATVLNPADVKQCTDALREMIAIGRSAGARVLIAQPLETGELHGHAKPGHDILGQVARDAGIEPIQIGPALERALDAGNPVYETFIHPSPAGQAVMAEVLLPPILDALRSKSATQP